MRETILDIVFGLVAWSIFLAIMVNIVLASKWFWQTYLGLH